MSACADPNCVYHHPGRPTQKCEGCGGNVAKILCHLCTSNATEAAQEIAPNIRLRQKNDALSARLAAVEKERDEAVALLRDMATGYHNRSCLVMDSGTVLHDAYCIEITDVLARLGKPEGETL